jgi:protein SCO1/2
VLRSLISDRPVVLALVYYECPMLCSEILSGVVSGLRPLSIRAGRDFDVIAISINSLENSTEALSKRDFYSRRYSSDGAGWHFLVGSQDSIHAVADAVGFHYRYDPKTKMFIHASGIMVLTPEGKVARYLYGVNYAPKDLKLSLIEASNRRIGSPIDQILLFCYHYDPATGKLVMNILRASSITVLLILAAVLTIAWRKELREGRRVFREASRT